MWRGERPLVVQQGWEEESIDTKVRLCKNFLRSRHALYVRGPKTTTLYARRSTSSQSPVTSLLPAICRLSFKGRIRFARIANPLGLR